MTNLCLERGRGMGRGGGGGGEDYESLTFHNHSV